MHAKVSADFISIRALRRWTSYEQEQSELEASTAELRKIDDAGEQQSANIRSLLKGVHCYAKPEMLLPTIAHKYADKITDYAPDKSSGRRVQQIDIHYNFRGEIDPPHETAAMHTVKRKQRQQKRRQTA